jgi:hypothetical protein
LFDQVLDGSVGVVKSPRLIQRRFNSRRAILLPGLAVVPLVLLGGNCEEGPLKVPKPESDSTSPKLEWVVLDKSTDEQTTVLEGKLNEPLNAHLVITLKAKDPEGVSRIRLEQATSWRCKDVFSEENTVKDTKSLATPVEQKLLPDQNGNVLTQIFLIDNVDLSYACQSGWVLVSATETLEGSGENYFNGMATSTLTLESTL